MHPFIVIGGVIGLLMFYPLCKSILNTGPNRSVQNPLTFALWSSLDGINAGATYEDGNYLLPALYCLGGWFVVGSIIKAKDPFKWTRFETKVAVMVVLCIIIWITTTNTLAALASVTALCIASVPQVRDTWNNPNKTPTLIYLGYAVAGLLSALGGKELSIVEVGYPVGSFLICVVITAFSMRKMAANPDADFT